MIYGFFYKILLHQHRRMWKGSINVIILILPGKPFMIEKTSEKKSLFSSITIKAF